MGDEQAKQFEITVDISTAYLIAKVFLPKNPNKLRNASREAVQAAHLFKNLTRDRLREIGDERARVI